eukprot:CAMPEP_0113237986 /NCGR_PEP_ID=MMETSP0008_2-20120614/4915_1 /TAXON_ID=97485 /ORGANISM="Prymnesium parvum" /LENGTH=42 /DNA_ID=CAMNT_0000085083 /DNA_START=37 /DNA_END=165 /DNA_ORIENTATION=- /assembly_acc=CAM_ASM_000153
MTPSSRTLESRLPDYGVPHVKAHVFSRDESLGSFAGFLLERE